MNLYMEFFLLGINTNVLGTVHGSGSGDGNAPPALIESNFRDGVYKVNGSAVTLSDMWVENLADWGSIGDFTITPGIGWVKSSVGPDYEMNDVLGPVLSPDLIPSVVNLADGFTVLIEGSVVYDVQPFDGSHESHSLGVIMGLDLADAPNWTAEWTVNAGPQLLDDTTETLLSNHQALATDHADLNLLDEITPIPPSPMIVRLAATYESDRIVFSLNGRPLVSGPAIGPTSPNDMTLMPLFNTLSTTWVSAISGLEYVAFYPKFANDADLMTLTAP